MAQAKKTDSENSQKKDNYVELSLPRLKMPKDILQLALILLLLGLSFAVGSLYTKVRYLEQGGAVGNTQQALTLDDQLITYAKDLNLDTKSFERCLSDGKYASRITNDMQEATALGINATPGFFINGKLLGGAFPFESFKEIIDKELAGTATQSHLDYSQELQQAFDGKAFNPVPKTVTVGSSPTKGGANAKVTIVEFSDFQCPFCSRALPTINQIMSEYKDDVRLVYKHYPITSIHPNAQKASEASECAREQNKFWEYHDLLFQNQQQWSQLQQATI